jgi:hypothetical protein
LTDARLTRETLKQGFTPIRWMLDVEGGTEVDFSRGQDRPRIYIVVARGASKLIASKFMAVRSGTYRFTASGEFLRPSAGSEFQWRVRCWTGGEYKIIWQSARLVDEQHIVTGDIAVPQDCTGALLELAGKGPVNDVDAEYVVNAVGFDRL